MEHQKQAVRIMQDYINDHIHEAISIDIIAAAASYSVSYARRIFIKHLGMTPAVYIRRLKLSKSALKLHDEHCQILDVAMEMGFGSVDGYQRAFRREFGCNPKEYSNSPVPIWLFTPYLLKTSKNHGFRVNWNTAEAVKWVGKNGNIKLERS